MHLAARLSYLFICDTHIPKPTECTLRTYLPLGNIYALYAFIHAHQIDPGKAMDNFVSRCTPCGWRVFVLEED
jgi:hypothetical protein